ncbi:MAG: hypothetical protein GXP58_09415 [Deltaproteobacteria bacterium]|nr:hypothetical protein [Deltaproteobacteria bacterium]
MNAVLHKIFRPKFLLYLVVIVLLNIAATSLFFRVDLTANHIYSLSRASRKVVSTLSEPLTIKVFFTKNLPAPYNTLERYLHDLLQEYSIAGNRYFNYQFYDVSGEENESARKNQEMAQNYGINPVQIRNIEQDQVKFQNAFMGMVLIHGDLIKTIPTITSTEGLEYKITSTIRTMNNKISALLALKDKVKVNLILSSSLQIVGPYMNLTGLAELPSRIKAVVKKLNEKNYGRLAFSAIDPTRDPSREKEIRGRQILPLQWDAFTDRRGKTIPAGHGYAGIMIQHGNHKETIPLLHIFRLPIFGTQYQLAKMKEIEEGIENAVENLINTNEKIGYLADHGTLPLESYPAMPGEAQSDSLSQFHKLLSEEYNVREVRLKDGGIPEGLPTLIIAGPTKPFSEEELYRVDQYLMRGGNLALFLDPFKETSLPQQGMMVGGQGPMYLPIHTGLEKLLSAYGIHLKAAYVLDKNCFRQEIPQAFGGGERQIYFAPIIKNTFINKSVPYLTNIKGLVLLKAAPLNLDEASIKKHALTATRLFSSSREAWKMEGRVNLNPMFLQPPRRTSDLQQFALAYTLTGPIPSYFADKPIPERNVNTQQKEKKQTAGNEKTGGIDMSHIQAQGITLKTSRGGRIFLIGTSAILKDNVLGDNGTSPNAQFVMNIFDALNHRVDTAVMRSKSQRFNPLKEVSPMAKTMIKAANIAGLPILIIFAGLIIWYRRSARKRHIQQIFTQA